MSRVLPSFGLQFFRLFLFLLRWVGSVCRRPWNRPLFQRDDEIAHMPSFTMCLKTISIYLSLYMVNRSTAFYVIVQSRGFEMVPFVWRLSTRYVFETNLSEPGKKRPKLILLVRLGGKSMSALWTNYEEKHRWEAISTFFGAAFIRPKNDIDNKDLHSTTEWNVCIIL